MYVTAQNARTALEERREDHRLQNLLREDLGELPEFLAQGPRAVLARQLATPNFEFHIFSTRARQAGLKVACPVYLDDKLCSSNPDKLALAKLTFYFGKGRNGGFRTKPHRIIDLARWDGQSLKGIKTLWGEGLVDFHNRLLDRQFPGAEVYDTSAWLRRMGGKPARFWPRLLSLFICDGILFENFHSEGHETEFTRRIIRPAIAEVEARYGVRPLIVPLVPIAKERDPYWSWYPALLEREVLQGLRTADAQPARKPDFVPLPWAAFGGSHA
jgi:hypothetical protein